MVRVLPALHSRVGDEVWETLSHFLSKCRNADLPEILVSRFPVRQWAFNFMPLRFFLETEVSLGRVWAGGSEFRILWCETGVFLVPFGLVGLCAS